MRPGEACHWWTAPSVSARCLRGAGMPERVNNWKAIEPDDLFQRGARFVAAGGRLAVMPAHRDPSATEVRRAPQSIHLRCRAREAPLRTSGRALSLFPYSARKSYMSTEATSFPPFFANKEEKCTRTPRGRAGRAPRFRTRLSYLFQKGLSRVVISYLSSSVLPISHCVTRPLKQ